MRRTILFVISLVSALCASAKVSLPGLFADGMVLQRGQAIPVWGWAGPGERFTVRLGRHRVEAVAGADGRWRVDLPRMKAGGPYTLTVGDTAFADVMVGDVWLCAGQSNVDVDVERVYPQYPAEIDADAMADVRLLRVENAVAMDAPSRDVRTTGWRRLDRQGAWRFSAIGYFLAKRMRQATGVPQGVIQSSWGGTPIEAWLPRDSMLVRDSIAVAEADFYADEALVGEISSLNGRLDRRWHAMLDARDPGVAGRWTAADHDDRTWQEASQYRLPVASRHFCGSYWVRQHIHVDAAHAGRPALLRLGTLYDTDRTYLNGREVGRAYYQYPPRRYDIPAGLLREGDNVVTVRFVNKSGAPSFVRGKPYRLEFAPADTIALSERWLVHEGAQMPPQPSVPLATQNLPCVLWNAMLRPIAPYALSGVVWYQGESNTGRAAGYEGLLGCLMRSWREAWQRDDLPFAVVQLANFMAPSKQPQDSQWARLRESQRLAVGRDVHAGLAVAIDLGEAVDIHPLRKKEVAERCALVFDRLVYGKKDVRLSPEPLSARIKGQDVVVTFDQPLKDGVVRGFEVRGGDGRYRNVGAVAAGNTVTIAGAADAVNVRYAWKDNPAEADGQSAGGLPMVPFEVSTASQVRSGFTPKGE